MFEELQSAAGDVGKVHLTFDSELFEDTHVFKLAPENDREQSEYRTDSSL
jgi:hypothetical protein